MTGRRHPPAQVRRGAAEVRRQRRSSTPTAGVLIGVAVVALAALVATVLHLIEKGRSHSPAVTPASATVLGEVTGVRQREQDAIGLPSSVAAPGVARHQPPLVLDGRPGAIFIGGEFCPNCAAERWAVVMAFSRFGTFSGLEETTSSPWDTDPSTPTFSFYGSSYRSRWISLVTVEAEGNDTSGPGTRKSLQPLTPLESTLWTRYEQRFGQPESFPFLDIGNEVFVTSSSYDPGVLGGLTAGRVAALLSRPSAPSTADIVATSDYLTAGICQLTADEPSAVCSVGAVREAARALGLA